MNYSRLSNSSCSNNGHSEYENRLKVIQINKEKDKTQKSIEERLAILEKYVLSLLEE